MVRRDRLQELHDGRTLGRAEAGQLESAGGSGLEGVLVVLLRPDSAHPMLHILAGEDAGHATVHRSGRLDGKLQRKGAVGRTAQAHLTQKAEDGDHGVVVEGDAGVVVVAAGKILGEAAVVVLHRKEIAHTAQGALQAERVARGRKEAHEEANLGGGGAVVDGSLGEV